MQASKTLQNGRPSSLSTSIEETHRRLEHFVAPLSHTGNGGLDMQMRLDADALELPAGSRSRLMQASANVVR